MNALAVSTAPRFVLVPFLDTSILAARDGDVVRVPMKRFCETLGLDWPPQARRIKRDEVLASGVTMMVIPSEGGAQQQTTLALELIPGFLAGCDAARYAPELRERVRHFRRECYAVLYQHFFRPRAAPTPVIAPPVVAPPDWRELDAARRAAAELIALLSAETRPQVRRLYHGFLVDQCGRLGREAPPLTAIGTDGDPAADALRALLAGLDTLTARRVAWNHAATGGRQRLAINLLEIARLFARNDIDVRIDDGTRTALATSTARWRITVETVRSALTRRATHCHVLEAIA